MELWRNLRCSPNQERGGLDSGWSQQARQMVGGNLLKGSNVHFIGQGLPSPSNLYDLWADLLGEVERGSSNSE